MNPLARAVLGQRRQLAVASLLTAAHQSGEALVPVLIGVVIDKAVANGGLVPWLAVLAGVFAVLSLSFRFGARAGERAAELAAHDLRLALTGRVLDPHGGPEAGWLPGELASLASGDAQRVGTLNRALPYGIAALAGLTVTAVVLLRMSVPLGLLVLLGAPPLLGLAHLLGRPLERRSHAERERAGQASGVAADLVAGLRVLKGLGAETHAAARYRRVSRQSLAATVRAGWAQAWHDGGMLALNGIFLAVVALVGGRLAAGGALTVGELVAAVGLAQYLLGPLTMLAHVNAEFAKARASARRIAEVLAAPPARQPGTARLPHPARGHLVLHGIEVKPGELVGVVTGPERAATLLHNAELDGIPLSIVDIEDVRAAVLVAPHEAELFEGTVLDNVGGADPTAALIAAGAADIAPDTELTERGRSLSGGQRQRVALARALAADPPVLVLHDPTTSVDAVIEVLVANGIRELRRGRTTIVVTNSQALLGVADRVVVLP